MITDDLKREKWLAYYHRNRAKIREQRRLRSVKNREHVINVHRVWQRTNNEKTRAYGMRWYYKNREKKRAAYREWRIKNLERNRARVRKWHSENQGRVRVSRKNRLASDPKFRITTCLRSRMHRVIRRCLGQKADSTSKLTGCTAEFLIGYLEARFKPGMSWSNYGPVWHIDHIRPCALFDLVDPKEQRRCFHYSNLQPLFAIDNKSKNDARPEPYQSELI